MKKYDWTSGGMLSREDGLFVYEHEYQRLKEQIDALEKQCADYKKHLANLGVQFNKPDNEKYEIPCLSSQSLQYG